MISLSGTRKQELAGQFMIECNSQLKGPKTEEAILKKIVGKRENLEKKAEILGYHMQEEEWKCFFGNAYVGPDQYGHIYDFENGAYFQRQPSDQWMLISDWYGTKKIRDND